LSVECRETRHPRVRLAARWPRASPVERSTSTTILTQSYVDRHRCGLPGLEGDPIKADERATGDRRRGRRRSSYVDLWQLCWLAAYRAEGLAGLDTRSHRPASCPHQAEPVVEVAVCEMRREHPRWGPVRIAFELGKDGCPGRVPSRMTVYRILVRHGLMCRARRRPDFARGSGLRKVRAAVRDSPESKAAQASNISSVPCSACASAALAKHPLPQPGGCSQVRADPRFVASVSFR
jgi:hypothetical protein